MTTVDANTVTLRTRINGRDTTLEAASDESLINVLRDDLGLCGTKVVCAAGVCGACTVQVDGTPMVSCLLPATAVDGRSVTTIEGLGDRDGLHPVQRALATHNGLQCGFCTPGFALEAAAFHDQWRAEHPPGQAPTALQVADVLAGHLCRCGAYRGIVQSVAAACRGDFDDQSALHPARVEAIDKLTGAAAYTVDVRLPGMQHGAFARSPLAHAVVESLPLPAGAVDLRAADRVVRYAGQPFAAVAAPSLAEAERLARDIEQTARFTVRPHVLSLESARAPGASPVYASRRARKAAPSSAEVPLLPTRWRGNVRGATAGLSWRRFTARRRVAAARRRGDDRLVDLRFTTAAQVHTPLEPHACVARWNGDGSLDVWLSTQAVSHLAHLIAGRWKLGHDRVRVHAAHIGGGFGGKQAVTSEVVAAVELARTTRAPVRVVLSRAEELTDGGSRPGTTTDLAIVASPEEQLRAITMDAYGEGGVSIGSTVAGLTRLLYGRAPRSLRDFDVVTNAPPGTPFRGPGGPPLSWALEQGVDQMAHQLDTDPIALRRRWDGNPKRARLYDWAEALPAWNDRQRAGSATGRFRRGIGVAAGNWLYFVVSDTEVELTVRDGRVLARTATQDIGTGSRSVLTGAVAHGLGVPRELVVAQVGDSAAPYGPASGGSSATTSVAPTAALAAERLRAKLDAAGAQLGDAAAEELSAKASRPRDARRYLTPSYHHLRAGRGLSGSVHVAEVEADTLLGHTRVLRVWGGIAVGKIWEPRLARSQCEGGIVQGVSFALYEQRLLDPVSGVVLTSNLEDYRIAGIADCPEIEIHFDERGWDHVAGGGVGLGELSTLAVAAAVANAVFNATGWRPTDLPIRPERLLAGLAGLDGN